MKRVTIRDVAAAAGVSHQTVSRVLNDRPDVAPDTRGRVLQVMRQMEYQPSAIARSLSQQRSFTIGVVTAGLSLIGPSRTLSGITEQAERMSYALLLKELPGFATNNVQSLLNSLLERRVDGIVWAVPEVGDNRAWLDDQPGGLPVPILFLTMQAHPGVPTASVDNYAGGRMATEHLLQQGYRHIAHISGPLDWWEARQRKAGWRDAMLAAGMAERELIWQAGDWSSASGELAIRALLSGASPIDAVFVGNDQMALSVLQVACRDGIQVPEELGVVGFDGLPEAAHYWPPLTTIYQDQPELGRLAVAELVQRIEAGRAGAAPPEPRAISLQPELVLRASSTRHT
ncbi:MAG: LacI family DNA-binding transcriptional regulator [Anaerolineae bacterium]|nr:LacI family DNA-binding transcriptional regulator [Anaerolineae bacterium]